MSDELATVRGYARDYGTDFVGSLVSSLQGTVDECEQALAEACSMKNADRAAAAAHKVKSGLVSLGAKNVADIAQEMEERAQAGEVPTSAEISALVYAARVFVADVKALSL